MDSKNAGKAKKSGKKRAVDVHGLALPPACRSSACSPGPACGCGRSPTWGWGPLAPTYAPGRDGAAKPSSPMCGKPLREQSDPLPTRGAGSDPCVRWDGTRSCWREVGKKNHLLDDFRFHFAILVLQLGKIGTGDRIPPGGGGKPPKRRLGPGVSMHPHLYTLHVHIPFGSLALVSAEAEDTQGGQFSGRWQAGTVFKEP